MLNGEKLIQQVLSMSGSTWVSRQQLQTYYTEYGGSIKDLEPLIKRKKILYYKDADLFTLPQEAKAEDSVAENCFRIQYIKPAKQYPDSTIDRYIAAYESTQKYPLHEGQKAAVRLVCNWNFCIVTGGPGTGKTTVLSCAAYVLRHLTDASICFTAPTGKAARRVKESTGEDACTVHKKFGLVAGGKDEKADASHLYEDVLIIDESSMNDIFLSATIFSAIKSGKRVIWVGDTDQLPSVGPGAVLRDLIRSHAVPVARLTKTFRQDNSSTLFTNIVNIREGRPDLVEGKDFHPVRIPDGASDKDTALKIMEIYKAGLEKYGDEQTVVLVPYRKSGICSNAISNCLQRIANPDEKQGFRHVNADGCPLFFKNNDLVMQLENRDECANGDVGRVIQCTREGLVVEFADAIVSYKPSEFGQLALAYSMTVNKSQGSEYQNVIMVLLDQHKAMLNRNILYTGITRAKKECTLVYQQTALEQAVAKKADEDRITLLTEKLEYLHAQYKYKYHVR